MAGSSLLLDTKAAMATTTMTSPLPTSVQVVADENAPQSGMTARPHPSTYWTVDGLIRSHASEEEEIPMIGYPVTGAADYEVHTAKTVDRYVDAACWWYQKYGLQPAVSWIRM